MDRPYVVVVLDIQHEYFPELFDHQELIERQYHFGRSLRHAAHICALSQFTRQTLLDRFGFAPEQITTVYPATDPAFESGSPWRGQQEQVLSRLGLIPGTYLLYPAHTWPHKNHRTLVEALALLKSELGHTPALVCTGRPRAAHSEFLKSVRDLKLEREVRWLGYRPSHEMPALFEGALALVYPSLFEGFGFPLLEAMACDCPVICSSATCLPEIAGPAALIADPLDARAWADAIRVIMTDPEQRNELIKKGRARVSTFSWTKFTSDLLQILNEVAPSSSSSLSQYQNKLTEKQDPQGSQGKFSSLHTSPVKSLAIRRRIRGRSLLSSAREYRESRRLVRSWFPALLAAIIAPEVLFSEVVIPRLQRLARQPVTFWSRLVSFWGRPSPMTLRLLDHVYPWWDGWVGPRVVILRTLKQRAHTLRLKGWPAFEMQEPLTLTVAIDESPVGKVVVSNLEPFEWVLPLPKPVPPGTHSVEIKASGWFTQKGDLRPLSWRIDQLELD
ncbi:glycosyltransferase family 4 protein [Thermoanaerobaculum aquaticum]|nr:glycosyltransferase family 1 protein [Thermoanaerobaculum aquaticum]